MPFGLAMAKGIGYDPRHPGILQPCGTESGFVGFVVQGEEGSVGRGVAIELTRRVFGSTVRWVAALPLPTR